MEERRDGTKPTQEKESLSIFWPLIISIIVIGLIEGILYFRYSPSLLDRSPWLLRDPYMPEGFDRISLYLKLKTLEKSNPDIIMVGDSSGFFSVQPKITMGYLEGLKLANLSINASYGYQGYKAVAQYAINNNPSVKYIVLNIYPFLLPTKRLEHVSRSGRLGQTFEKLFISPVRFLAPPSAYWTMQAKHLCFLRSFLPSTHRLSNHIVALDAHYRLRDTLGWIPEYDERCSRTTDYHKFEFDYKKNILGFESETFIYDTLANFAKMCKEKNVRLIISFNPIGWQHFNDRDEDVQRVFKELERVQIAFPDVWILNHPITIWEPVKFGMYNHIAREYSHLSSARLGKALSLLISHPESYQPFDAGVAMSKIAPSPKVEIRASGVDASLEQKKAAMAFFLYAATGNIEYRLLLSKRSIKLLEDDDAFKFMIWDNKTRLDSLAWEGINFDYDLKNLRGVVVYVSNGQRCVDKNSDLWIRLDGSIKYTMKIKDETIEAPVKWSSNNNIFVPIIFEDGQWKFDGYCREDTGDDAIKFQISPTMLGFDFIKIPGRSQREIMGKNVDNISSFEISTTEVTQLQWYRIMGSNPANLKGGYRPIENVRMTDVREFIKNLEAMVGGDNYRLPKEEEWQSACCESCVRNPKQSREFFKRSDKAAWFAYNSSGATHMVAEKRPNERGLFDMLGNVWEWVELDEKSTAFAKGGAWNSDHNSISCNTRGFAPLDYRAPYIGFRIARDYGENR
jgi:formylglycine-generating enzyme